MARWFGLLFVLLGATAIACSASSEPTTTATPAVTPTSAPSVTPESTATSDPNATVGDACTFERATTSVFGSVVQVVTADGGGTAFAIGNGEFLTAAHVVAEGGPISLRGTNAEADATIVGLELDTDIAILRSELSGIEPVRFGELDDLAAGQRVAVAGYPTYVEDDPSVVSGLLSKVVEDPDLGFGTFLQTDAAVNPGNSGGPMFNECGDVVGMVVIKIVSTDVEGISWAVAENTLQSALPRVRRKGPPEPGGGVDPWYVEVEPEARYISNTGGSGVSFRDDCVENARMDGSWPEGAAVVISHEGIGFCEGWSIVLDDTDASWVQNDFLAASPPGVSQPATPAPTAAATPRPTSTVAPPTATPPAATATPAATRQEVIDYLFAVHDDALEYANRLTTIVGDHNDDLITNATASSRSYALETEAKGYSDLILLPSNSLADVSASCEQARQWLGDSVFYTSLSAGYSGLGYEFWPNYGFSEADRTSAQSFDSLSTALDYIEACIAGD